MNIGMQMLHDEYQIAMIFDNFFPQILVTLCFVHMAVHMVVRSSNLHNRISYTGNTIYSYWIRAQVALSHRDFFRVLYETLQYFDVDIIPAMFRQNVFSYS